MFNIKHIEENLLIELD